MTWLLPTLLLSCNSLPANVDVEYSSTSTNGGGTVQVPVQISGHRSFLVTGLSDKYVAVEELWAPNGNVVLHWEDWYWESESLTYAFWAEGNDVAFNWPIRAEDGPLTDGEWTVVLSTTNAAGYYAGNEPVDVVVHKNTDDGGPQSGAVEAVIVYAKGLRRNGHLHDSVQTAVEHWRDIWSDQGISLSVRYKSSRIDTDLEYPGYGGGDAIWSAASKAKGAEVVVLIGETIDGGLDTYGVSGGIPGSLYQTERSATIISWLANAGQDATFDDGEIQLLGETLAHEVGHYFGLFHPVEDGWEYWDAIDDTPKCTSANNCESELGENLMFPYSLCGWQNCTSQYILTDGQTGVLQRYTGTL